MSSLKISLIIDNFNSLGISYSKLSQIWEHYQSWVKAIENKDNFLSSILEVDKVSKLLEQHSDSYYNGREKIFQDLKINLINHTESSYPYLLSQISDPPFLLYYKGKLPTDNNKLVAVVGMRTPSNYGKIVTNKLAEGLAKAGCVIVSGLAYGIDSLAHTSAVKNNSPTIAVLGGGLDEKSFYPKSNINLAEQIVNTGGCLMSEYPPFTSPQKHFFIARNRIVAGMSELTLVTEAKKKSGSLITADFALNENRIVASVMGSILEAGSEGTNTLIKNGASPITRIEDLLEILNLEPPKTENQIIELSEIESLIMEQLTFEPIHIDIISEKLALPISTLLTTLTFLELKKLISKNSNNQFSKL